MRMLITGITGFVGSYLAKKLLPLGREVYGLYRRRADGNVSKRLVEMGILGQVKLVEGDMTDLTSLLFALDKAQPDVIFHLASQSYVPRSFADPLETFRVNSLGTQNLLEASRLKDLDCKIVRMHITSLQTLQIMGSNVTITSATLDQKPMDKKEIAWEKQYKNDVKL